MVWSTSTHFPETPLHPIHVREKTLKIDPWAEHAAHQSLYLEDIFECCASTEHMLQHGILSLVQQMLCKHQRVDASSTENITTETNFCLTLEWILPTFYSATNCTLTSDEEDILCSGHIPYISWRLSGRVWQLHRALSAHDQTELTVQTHFLPSRWWMHSEIQTSLLPKEGWVSQKLFHWWVSLQGSSWCLKKGSRVHYTDFWNTKSQEELLLAKELDWHHRQGIQHLWV